MDPIDLSTRLDQRRNWRETGAWLLLLAGLFVLIWGGKEWTGNVSSVDRIVSAALAVTLLALSAIDLDQYRLPDWITGPLIISGLLMTYIRGSDFIASILGAVIGYFLIFLIERYWRFRYNRDGIGMGDAKLLAGLGAWLGLYNLPVVLLVASSSALILIGLRQIVIGTETDENILPFGPFLCLAGWLLWAFPIYSV